MGINYGRENPAGTTTNKSSTLLREVQGDTTRYGCDLTQQQKGLIDLQHYTIKATTIRYHSDLGTKGEDVRSVVPGVGEVLSVVLRKRDVSLPSWSRRLGY